MLYNSNSNSSHSSTNNNSNNHNNNNTPASASGCRDEVHKTRSCVLNSRLFSLSLSLYTTRVDAKMTLRT